MKATVHPQLFAAFAIAGAVLFGYTRSGASVETSVTLPDFAPPPPMTYATNAPVIIRRDPFSAVDEVPAMSSAQASFSVRAVVLGERRYALVDEGQTTNIVSIGDSIGGATVRDIDLHGLTLSNGVRLISNTSQP